MFSNEKCHNLDDISICRYGKHIAPNRCDLNPVSVWHIDHPYRSQRHSGVVPIVATPTSQHNSTFPRVHRFHTAKQDTTNGNKGVQCGLCSDKKKSELRYELLRDRYIHGIPISTQNSSPLVLYFDRVTKRFAFHIETRF